jgi:hypothetical protein
MNNQISNEKSHIKKIALLFYGRLKKYKEHHDNIMSIFCSNSIIDCYLSSDNSDNNELKGFIDIYKPKSYINDKIEHNINLSVFNRAPETNVDNMIRHFINKKRVFKLLEEEILKSNITYDIIISLRLDLLFNNKLSLNTINSNILYIPIGYDYRGINDQIAMGDFITMKKYNNIIDNVIFLLSNNILMVNPESLTKTNIVYNKLVVERIYLEYRIDK